jgi:hypothetical protein
LPQVAAGDGSHRISLAIGTASRSYEQRSMLPTQQCTRPCGIARDSDQIHRTSTLEPVPAYFAMIDEHHSAPPLRSVR